MHQQCISIIKSHLEETSQRLGSLSDKISALAESEKELLYTYLPEFESLKSNLKLDVQFEVLGVPNMDLGVMRHIASYLVPGDCDKVQLSPLWDLYYRKHSKLLDEPQKLVLKGIVDAAKDKCEVLESEYDKLLHTATQIKWIDRQISDYDALVIAFKKLDFKLFEFIWNRAADDQIRSFIDDLIEKDEDIKEGCSYIFDGIWYEYDMTHTEYRDLILGVMKKNADPSYQHSSDDESLDGECGKLDAEGGGYGYFAQAADGLD